MKKNLKNSESPVIETEDTERRVSGNVLRMQNIAINNLFGCLDLDATPYHGQLLAEVIEPMYKHVSQIAMRLGCQVEETPSLSPDPTASELRDVLLAFGRLNAQVWPKEQTFEPESEDNRPWRQLGQAMHWLYEVIKYQNMIAGGQHWSDPTFFPIFHEGMRRADAGEPIAIAVMRDKWGITSRGLDSTCSPAAG